MCALQACLDILPVALRRGELTRAELLGAINYLAAAVIMLDRKEGVQ